MRDHKQDAQQISEMVNSITFDPQKFCAEMEKEHKTLQQNFTRLCLEWLRTCASEDYRYDGRNEASHKIAKDLLPYLQQTIPYV